MLFKQLSACIFSIILTTSLLTSCANDDAVPESGAATATTDAAMLGLESHFGHLNVTMSQITVDTSVYYSYGTSAAFGLAAGTPGQTAGGVYTVLGSDTLIARRTASTGVYSYLKDSFAVEGNWAANAKWHVEGMEEPPGVPAYADDTTSTDMPGRYRLTSTVPPGYTNGTEFTVSAVTGGGVSADMVVLMVTHKHSGRRVYKTFAPGLATVSHTFSAMDMQRLGDGPSTLIVQVAAVRIIKRTVGGNTWYFTAQNKDTRYMGLAY